jgi:hypothetical protein
MFQAIALFNANQHEEAMLLVKEVATACLNADIGCRVAEVGVLWLRLVIDTDICNFHIRHIYVLNLELKPCVTRVTMKPPVTSPPLSTPALPHQNPLIKSM